MGTRPSQSGRDVRNEAPLVVRLFGPFDVAVRGEPLPRLRSRKGQWLLALLVLRHGRNVERAWLAAALWPESSAPQGLTHLRTTLADLRRALGPEAGRLCASTAQMLSLDLLGAESDVIAFDAAIARGDVASLEHAAALYRGQLLEGCVEEWVFPERQVREQACLQALDTLAAQALARGDADRAVQYLRRGTTIDPLRESSQRALMQALAARGNYAAALFTYRELRLLLHRELNTAPDPETAAVFQQIQAEARRRGEGGKTRSNDKTKPLSRPHNLPAPVTSLIGRSRELAALRALLAREDVRLVTLTGAGGTGKTRLALQTAADLIDRFEDGVFFVSLAPLRDPTQVTGSIAQTLGIRETNNEPLRNSLAYSLREKRLLLVLDNFEQIAAAAPLLTDLLAAAPRLKILVTSRAALRLRGEKRYSVSPLALPDLTCLPAAGLLSRSPAVALFVERVQDLLPEFTITDENAGAIAEICVRLDGLPLALELAAARIRLLSPRAMVARLEHRMSLLVGGPHDLPARQQTLRQAIEWSYDLLDEPEKRLFRRLSVFSRGFTLDAAERICNPAQELSPDLLSGIESLLSKSLLHTQAVVDTLPGGESGEPRVHMLETLREYGREALEASGEAEHIRGRHLQYFLGLAEAAQARLRGPEQRLWLDRLEGEHDNFRTALAWAMGHAETEPALRLAAALALFWRRRGHLSEGRSWLQNALSPGRTSPTGDDPEAQRLRARALRAAGMLALFQSDGAAAHSLVEESLSLSHPIGDLQGVAEAHFLLGKQAQYQGDRPRALAEIQRSLTIYRELSDPPGLADALKGVANLTTELNVVHTLYEESLSIYRALGDGDGHADVLHNRAWRIDVEQGDWEAAEARYQESLAIWGQVDSESGRGVALCQSSRSEVAFHAGDLDRARALCQETVERWRRLGDRTRVASALIRLGEIVRCQGDASAAERFLEEGCGIYREAGHLTGVADALCQLGWAALDRGEHERAVECFAESLTRSHQAGRSVCVALCLLGVAGVAAREGHAVQAARLLGAAEPLLDAARPPLAPARRAEADQLLAGIYAALGTDSADRIRAEARGSSLEQAISFALEWKSAGRSVTTTR